MPILRLLTLSVCAFSLACGSGDKGRESDDRDDDEKASAAVNLDPSSITASDVALGDSIFHGLIGATSCQACHGPKGKSGAAAPDLTDTTWLHSDGSFPAIYKQIETGVMAPKQFSSMMPPFGGAPLTPEKHRAVAAYVYKLSHP